MTNINKTTTSSSSVGHAEQKQNKKPTVYKLKCRGKIEKDSYQASQEKKEPKKISDKNSSITTNEQAKSIIKGVISPAYSMFSSPKSFIKGTGLIGGAVALCALTGGAAAPAIVTGGVILGGAKIIKNLNKAIKSENKAETKKALVKIGTGAAITAASILGAKKASTIGKIAEGKNFGVLKSTSECIKKTPSAISKSWKALAGITAGLLAGKNVINKKMQPEETDEKIKESETKKSDNIESKQEKEAKATSSEKDKAVNEIKTEKPSSEPKLTSKEADEENTSTGKTANKEPYIKPESTIEEDTANEIAAEDSTETEEANEENTSTGKTANKEPYIKPELTIEEEKQEENTEAEEDIPSDTVAENTPEEDILADEAAENSPLETGIENIAKKPYESPKFTVEKTSEHGSIVESNAENSQEKEPAKQIVVKRGRIKKQPAEIYRANPAPYYSWTEDGKLKMTKAGIRALVEKTYDMITKDPDFRRHLPTYGKVTFEPKYEGTGFKIKDSSKDGTSDYNNDETMLTSESYIIDEKKPEIPDFKEQDEAISSSSYEVSKTPEELWKNPEVQIDPFVGKEVPMENIEYSNDKTSTPVHTVTIEDPRIIMEYKPNEYEGKDFPINETFINTAPSQKFSLSENDDEYYASEQKTEEPTQKETKTPQQTKTEYMRSIYTELVNSKGCLSDATYKRMKTTDYAQAISEGVSYLRRQYPFLTVEQAMTEVKNWPKYSSPEAYVSSTIKDIMIMGNSKRWNIKKGA